MAIGSIIGILVAVVVAYILFRMAGGLLSVVANAILGIIALWAINSFTTLQIPITFWNVVIVAIGGIIGLLAVILLNALKVAF